ncbi:hypothetical protein [Thalassobacillus sp. B23F22_16]|uniref:hypothetical protein n=1 Tax=Thalassobacillus sp. B23F22_16 TaxID=3459513 RepID=UPI00373F9041
MLKNSLFKWLPYKDQDTSEKRLVEVMKRLKIGDYHFNWDRSSCYIEFDYKDHSYRLEHSVEKAKRKGILLKNGLDCLAALTQTLEDLCVIIDRGTYPFETWIAGMQDDSKEEAPKIESKHQNESNAETDKEEFNKEFIPFRKDSTVRDFERKQVAQGGQRK